jgi:hypothetical protein
MGTQLGSRAAIVRLDLQLPINTANLDGHVAGACNGTMPCREVLASHGTFGASLGLKRRRL